ncbi:MAG: fibronectin type III domain-containing protein [Hormoscilla sp. GUM202]|nr:fibronectin type III domain-containing protein [Hormoscilla sp. GUM202]
MATFPKSEMEIATLAENMISGLTANTEVYPAPIIPVDQLQNTLNELKSAQHQVVATKSAAEQAVTTKNEVLKKLIGLLKSNIHYAEAVTQREDDELKLIGWGGRSAPRKIELPGPIEQFQAIRTEPGTIQLTWQRSRKGGRVVAYKVQELNRTLGVWQTVETALNNTAQPLRNQEVVLYYRQSGEALAYRIVPCNQAGEGTPSNTVEVLA